MWWQIILCAQLCSFYPFTTKEKNADGLCVYDRKGTKRNISENIERCVARLGFPKQNNTHNRFLCLYLTHSHIYVYMDDSIYTHRGHHNQTIKEQNIISTTQWEWEADHHRFDWNGILKWLWLSYICMIRRLCVTSFFWRRTLHWLGITFNPPPILFSFLVVQEFVMSYSWMCYLSLSFCCFVFSAVFCTSFGIPKKLFSITDRFEQRQTQVIKNKHKKWSDCLLVVWKTHVD